MPFNTFGRLPMHSVNGQNLYATFQKMHRSFLGKYWKARKNQAVSLFDISEKHEERAKSAPLSRARVKPVWEVQNMLECDLFVGKRLQQAKKHWSLRARSVRDQGWRPQHHQGSDYGISHCLHMLISMHWWRKAFIMVNSSIGACDLLDYTQGVHRCELSVMKISFDQTLLRHNIKKVSSNPSGSGEYLLYQLGSYQNCSNTNPSYWTSVFCWFPVSIPES